MKLPFLLLVLCLVASLQAQTPALPAGPAGATVAAPARSPLLESFRDIAHRVAEKYKAGQRTAADLAPEFADLDTLLARHPEKNEDTARLANLRATIYLEYLRDEDTALKYYTAVVEGYPGTRPAEEAARRRARLLPEYKAEQARKMAERAGRIAAMTGQPAPEIDFTWSTRAGLRKLSDLRGRVVVLDFWATWCAPCIASFPKLRAEVEHFKGAPVVILGVTSLQGGVSGLGSARIDTKGDPQKEYGLMPEFMRKYEMTWEVSFSAQEVFNPAYEIRGIPSVVIIAPDGTLRHMDLNPHSPDADIQGKVTALLREFKLTGPGENAPP